MASETKDEVPQDRINQAVALISEHGYVDGERHKQWVLDQVLRVLLGPEQYPRFIEENFCEQVDYCDGKYLVNYWETGTPP